MLPTTSTGPTSTDIYDLMTAELELYITPLMMRVREDHKLTIQDSLTVTNTNAYDIPPRAIGSKVKNVEIKDATTFRVLPRIEIERIPKYSTTGQVTGYWIQDDQVHMLPTPGQANPMRIYYFMRPGICVDYISVGEVASFNVSAGTVTLTALPPAGFTTSSLYDCIKGTPNFRHRAIDMVCTNITGSVMTFSPATAAPLGVNPITDGSNPLSTGGIPPDIAVGDTICLQYQSGIPQCPVEMMPLLAQRTAFKVLEAIGDPRAMLTLQICEKMEKDAMTVLTPRAEGNHRVIVNPYGPGWRRNRYRR